MSWEVCLNSILHPFAECFLHRSLTWKTQTAVLTYSRWISGSVCKWNEILYFELKVQEQIEKVYGPVSQAFQMTCTNTGIAVCCRCRKKNKPRSHAAPAVRLCLLVTIFIYSKCSKTTRSVMDNYKLSTEKNDWNYHRSDNALFSMKLHICSKDSNKQIEKLFVITQADCTGPGGDDFEETTIVRVHYKKKFWK